MNPLETTEIGSTGLEVTRIGLGGAPMGGLFSDVSSENAFISTCHTLVQSSTTCYTIHSRVFKTLVLSS